jgi:Protein of unknown function (DUF2637)
VETSGYSAMAEPRPAEPSPRLRAAAFTAVAAGLVLVGGAAFVLSYQGIHQIALNAGVSAELARLYPVILDAMLVMSCAAALALRTAGLWTRCYVWACLILLLAAVATGNALYAMNISLPAQPTRAVVAVLPWALLLMGFGMLLAMLRHWRRIRAASTDAQQAGPASPGNGAAASGSGGAVSWAGGPGKGPGTADTPRTGVRELMEPRAGQPPARAGAAAGAAGTGAAIANGEAAGGKPPGPAATPEGTDTAGRDDAAPRPPATLTDEDLDVGPAVSYEAEPTAPAGTAGAVRATGPAGATAPPAPAGAGSTPAATPPGPGVPAPGTAVTPAGALPTAGPVAGPASATLAAGPVRAATPAVRPVPGPAPAPGAGAPPGTTVPFLDRILGGPTHPNAPETDGG